MRVQRSDAFRAEATCAVNGNTQDGRQGRAGTTLCSLHFPLVDAELGSPADKLCVTCSSNSPHRYACCLFLVGQFAGLRRGLLAGPLVACTRDALCDPEIPRFNPDQTRVQKLQGCVR